MSLTSWIRSLTHRHEGAVMPTPPVNTPDEIAAARLRALEVRDARAELLHKLRDGNDTLSALMEQGAHGTGDHVAGRIEIGDAVLAIRGVGHVRAAEILDGIDPDERLSGLTKAQRARIVKTLDAVHP